MQKKAVVRMRLFRIGLAFNLKWSCQNSQSNCNYLYAIAMYRLVFSSDFIKYVRSHSGLVSQINAKRLGVWLQVAIRNFFARLTL